MKFRLSCVVGVSAYTEIEADTLAEAIKKSKERGVVIGYPRCGFDPGEKWMIEEADGEPQNIHEDRS